MQSSARTGSIKIDCTQLMQVEMPIVCWRPDRNGINGKAAELRWDSGTVFRPLCTHHLSLTLFTLYGVHTVCMSLHTVYAVFHAVHPHI